MYDHIMHLMATNAELKTENEKLSAEIESLNSELKEKLARIKALSDMVGRNMGI